MVRRDRVVLGTALMVIGATVGVTWLLGHEQERLPFWPVWVFVAVLVVGVVFVASAARSEIDREHAAEIRRITARLQDVANGNDGDPYRSTEERSIYQAHRGKLAERETAVKRAVEAEAKACEALRIEILEAARAAFSQAAFWFPNAIAERALQRLQGSDDVQREIGEHEIDIVRPMVEWKMMPPLISWSQLVIWSPLIGSVDAGASDQDLEAKVQEVGTWFKEVRASESARIYRDAVLGVRARRNELGEAADRLTGRAIGRRYKCTICNPIRAWEFWR